MIMIKNTINSGKLLTISQVSRGMKISCDTIRMYERYGLIKEPIRADNGYRQYSEEIVGQLRFIINTKKTGFTLKEIKELLTIYASDLSCTRAKNVAIIKLNQVRERILESQKIELVLSQFVVDCNNTNHASCPLLNNLKMID